MLVPLTVPTISLEVDPALYPANILLLVESNTAARGFVVLLSKTTGVPKEIEVPLTVPTMAVP